MLDLFAPITFLANYYTARRNGKIVLKIFEQGYSDIIVIYGRRMGHYTISSKYFPFLSICVLEIFIQVGVVNFRVSFVCHVFASYCITDRSELTGLDIQAELERKGRSKYCDRPPSKFSILSANKHNRRVIFYVVAVQ
jgi:hypothetical protein